MYGKIFESIFNSSLADKTMSAQELLKSLGPDDKVPLALMLFEQLIVICDRNGIIDMTPDAISRKINWPIGWVRIGLKQLQESDSESRSPLMEGKRITLLEPETRNWGWLIINHEYYRNLQSYEDRQTYKREYQKEYMKNYRQEKNGSKKPKKIEYTPEFEKWWSLYPARGGVKAGKEAALEQFKKFIRSDEDFQNLIKATERYKTVEFPKDPERFLKKNYFRDWIGSDIKTVKGQPARFQDAEGVVWEMGERGWKQVAEQKK